MRVTSKPRSRGVKTAIGFIAFALTIALVPTSQAAARGGGGMGGGGRGGGIGGGARMGGGMGGGHSMGGVSGRSMGGMSAGRSFGGAPRSFGGAPRSYGSMPRSYGMSAPRSYGSMPRSYGAAPRSYSIPPNPSGAMSRSYGAVPRSYSSAPRSYAARPSTGRVTPMTPGAGARGVAPGSLTPRGGARIAPEITSGAGRMGGMPGRQIAGLPAGRGLTGSVAPRTPSMRNTAPGISPGRPTTMVVRPGQGGMTALSPQVRPASQGLNTWVRDSNRLAGGRTRPGLGTAGNAIPRGARTLDASRLARDNPAAASLRREFGDPTNRFAVNPRHNSGEWDGHNGWHGDHHNGHHEDEDIDFIFGLGFFYPFYFGNPWWWGFNYPGYYPSIYSYWGWTPGWVLPSQVYYSAPAPVYISESPYTYYGTYRDVAGAQQAINDIRAAWLTGNASLISAHLSDQLDIRVSFSGKYAYTTAAKDYYGMTLDAIATSRVVSMDFGNPVWLTDSDVLYTGKQVFFDPDNVEHTVYLSYRLAHVDNNWYIVGIGSSLQPVSAGTGETQ